MPWQSSSRRKGTTLSTKTVIRPPDTRAVRRRVSLSDRIALRVGLSLIIWSRRTHHVRHSVDLETRRRLEQERAAREAAWLLQVGLQNRWR